MHYGILGPLEVSDGGRPVEVAGAKQRALLAVLLLNANRVVSRDELTEALWEDRAPDTATKALQVHVSQLRKILGVNRLVTRSPGYALRVEDGELDLHRFEALVAEARRSEPREAADLLRDALSLWRGPALADFAFDRFSQSETARLEEMHLAVLEDRFEADLTLGSHRALVGELESLIAEHPLRERLRGQLLLALYRSGRQADALDAYQAARAALVDELGIEPGRELRELHQAILNQDPRLDLDPEEEPEPVETSTPELEPPEREMRKTVSAVAVAVTISSSGGEPLDPEPLRRIEGRVASEIETAVARHGGRVETITADVVNAVFGMPVAHEDDAFRAVRTAADVRDALDRIVIELNGRGLELGFGVGIGTGEVVTGTAGAAQPRITGKPLARASRLAQEAVAGDLLVDTETWQLVRDGATATRAGDAWRLADVTSATSPNARRLDSPMVGRGRERRRLQDAFDQAVSDRSCQLFTVLGPAGVGKSRLVQEFLTGVEGMAHVARGRCLPYGEGITYWPLLEVVKEVVRLEDDESAEQAQEKIVAALGGRQEADLAARRVAELIGLADAEAGAEEGFAAVQVLFEALASARPLVVVFDDIHWAEPTFLDLIEHLAGWTREAPILFVCLARHELLDVRPVWGGGKLNATTALLEPLSDAECAQLIENLVGGAELAEQVGERIVAAAEGNPLFVEQMLAMLVDDGSLVHEEGRWTAARDVSEVPVPPTIRALLAARLDQLDVTERRTIECAAVAGKVFQEPAVVELIDADPAGMVASSLAALVRKELIRPDPSSFGGRTYRFRHLLIRDAAYDSIPKEARATLHARFGRWLEQAAGDRAIEYEEVIGYHLEQAYRYIAEVGAVDDTARALGRDAAERLGQAGRRAFVRSDAPAGVNLVSRAVTLLPPDDPLRVDFVPNVRVVQGLGIDMSWADHVLTEAVETAATTGDRLLAAQALVQRGLLRLFTTADVTPDELIDAADRSITVFEQFDDQLGLARAWRLKAQAHYLGRRGRACADASERALEHIRRFGSHFEEQEIVEWLVIALLLGPTHATEAAERCRRVLDGISGRPMLEATVLAALAPIEAMKGDLAEASSLLEQAREIMMVGQWMWIAAFWECFILQWRGDSAAAEQELLPAYEALRELGEKSHFSSIAHALSTAVYAQGRYEEAEALTRECEEAASPNDVHSQILWRSVRAMTRARAGDSAAGESLAREAVSYALVSDFYPACIDAHLALAEVLELAGERDGAARALEEALRFCELKGNVYVAEQARTRLAAYAD